MFLLKGPYAHAAGTSPDTEELILKAEKLDLRNYTEKQKEILAECARDTVNKVALHNKIWSKPTKSRSCIATQASKLKSYGITLGEYRTYLQQNKLVKLFTTERHNVELVFLYDIEDNDVLEQLFEYDRQLVEDQEYRKQLRARIKAEGAQR